MKTLRISFEISFLVITLFFSIILGNNSGLSPYSATFNNHNVVFAEQEQWARIVNENTPLYSDQSLTMIKFYLPRSYFLKVVNAQEQSTRVVYMDGRIGLPLKEGYVKTCDLFLFDGIPSNPYPELELTVITDEVLFSDTNKQYPKAVLTQGSVATYYGQLNVNNENFCYVYCNGYVGYVRKSAFATFEIPPHSLPLNEQSSQDEESSNESTVSTQPQNSIPAIDSTMKIVIIIAVAITCVSVIYLLFKPKPTTDFKIATWRDEDDF